MRISRINTFVSTVVGSCQMGLLDAAKVQFVPFNLTVEEDATHESIQDKHGRYLRRKVDGKGKFVKDDFLNHFNGAELQPQSSASASTNARRETESSQYQYGYFQISYFPSLCIDIPNSETTVDDRQKLKFKRCEPGKKSQLWRIDDDCPTDIIHPNDPHRRSKRTNLFDHYEFEGYEFCGKVHPLVDDTKCIQVRKATDHHARLYMHECREHRFNQIWVYDYDCLMPSGDFSLTATTWREDGALGGDPVLLEECGGNSLDFNDFEE